MTPYVCAPPLSDSPLPDPHLRIYWLGPGDLCICPRCGGQMQRLQMAQADLDFAGDVVAFLVKVESQLSRHKDSRAAGLGGAALVLQEVFNLSVTP